MKLDNLNIKFTNSFKSKKDDKKKPYDPTIYIRGGDLIKKPELDKGTNRYSYKDYLKSKENQSDDKKNQNSQIQGNNLNSNSKTEEINGFDQFNNRFSMYNKGTEPKSTNIVEEPKKDFEFKEKKIIEVDKSIKNPYSDIGFMNNTNLNSQVNIKSINTNIPNFNNNINQISSSNTFQPNNINLNNQKSDFFLLQSNNNQIKSNLNQNNLNNFNNLNQNLNNVQQNYSNMNLNYNNQNNKGLNQNFSQMNQNMNLLNQNFNLNSQQMNNNTIKVTDLNQLSQSSKPQDFNYPNQSDLYSYSNYPKNDKKNQKQTNKIKLLFYAFQYIK